jgi:hypothetical protein
MIRAALALALSVTPALAGDWTPLTGPEITAALTARTLGYEGGGTQTFFADGRTLYDGGGPEWGRWRVEGDRYCSVWPPSDRWTCYGVERHARGLDLRFVAEDGTPSDGRYIDL